MGSSLCWYLVWDWSWEFCHIWLWICFSVGIRNSANVNILSFVVDLWALLVPMSMELILLPGYEILVSHYYVESSVTLCGWVEFASDCPRFRCWGQKVLISLTTNFDLTSFSCCLELTIIVCILALAESGACPLLNTSFSTKFRLLVCDSACSGCVIDRCGVWTSRISVVNFPLVSLWF